MNTTITFPVRPPALKLTRSAGAAAPVSPPAEAKWIATLAEERRRLQEDHDALRVREENLREYEARLRALQDQIESGRPAPVVTARSAAPFARPLTKSPFEQDPALQAAWEKLHRSRELLDAEQTHMREERIMVHEKESDIMRREKAVTAREARVLEREQLVAEATPPLSEEPQPVASEHTMSAVTRLTRGPFNMARSVFGSKK
jgi:hypothetical protein